MLLKKSLGFRVRKIFKVCLVHWVQVFFALEPFLSLKRGMLESLAPLEAGWGPRPSLGVLGHTHLLFFSPPVGLRLPQALQV